jgi:hypothetical protein
VERFRRKPTADTPNKTSDSTRKNPPAIHRCALSETSVPTFTSGPGVGEGLGRAGGAGDVTTSGSITAGTSGAVVVGDTGSGMNGLGSMISGTSVNVTDGEGEDDGAEADVVDVGSGSGAVGAVELGAGSDVGLGDTVGVGSGVDDGDGPVLIARMSAISGITSARDRRLVDRTGRNDAADLMHFYAV